MEDWAGLAFLALVGAVFTLTPPLVLKLGACGIENPQRFAGAGNLLCYSERLNAFSAQWRTGLD